MLKAGFNCTCSIFCTEFLLQMFWTKLSSLDFLKFVWRCTVFDHIYTSLQQVCSLEVRKNAHSSRPILRGLFRLL